MAGVSSCMKYSMFIFNFLFWVCGCIIMGFSIWMRVSKSAQADLDVDSSVYPAINLLIAVGSIIMVLGFLGCCGAAKESSCMLLLFFIGLLAILLLQIVAGILGAVYKSQLKDLWDETLKVSIPMLQGNTAEDKEFQSRFHNFETQYKCCGLMEGVKDWGKNQIPNQGCSCAEVDKGTSACVNNIYSKPCGDVIIDLAEKNMIIVIGIAFGLAFIEVLGLVFSMILYCQIQRK